MSIDITKPNREGIQRAAQEFEAAREARAKADADDVRKTDRSAKNDAQPVAKHDDSDSGDRIELSAAARMLASESKTASDERRIHLDDLRARYLEGSLNTPARVARAAAKLLGGE